MRLRALVLAASVLVGGLFLSASSTPAARTRPNIVMLMTDDQTVESMRVLPHVRQLIGAQGVTFLNSFVSYPMCCPSRTTYLTGQYAHNHGVLFNQPPTGGYQSFKHQDTTFPVALQRAGYYTIHIGKYMNGYGGRHPRVPPGWNDFRGLVDPWTYNYYGFHLNINGKVTAFPRSEHDYQTDVFARMAAAIIRQRARQHQPFFLNVAFVAPHSASRRDETDMGPQPAPVGHGMMANRLAVPPLRYRGHFRNEPIPRPPSFDEADISHKPAFFRRMSFFRRFTAADIRDIAARYRATLETLLAVDDAVIRIVKALRDTGQLDHTVILYTSDNGFFNGEHRIRAGKYYVYEPSIRVPLLMRGPGIPAGATRSELVANIDLAPTILDLAGATPLRTMDGISLVPIMQDPKKQTSRDLLLESGKNSVYPATYAAVRTPRYIYVEYSTGDRELYDLQTDPDELNNRYNDPALATVQHELQRRLEQLRTCAGISCR